MNISAMLQQHRNLLAQSALACKKRNWRSHTLLMLHHKIHIRLHIFCTSWMGARSGNPMSSQYYFKLTCWTNRTERNGLWNIAARRSVLSSLRFQRLYILIRSLKNRCEPSKSVSLCSLPLEVLIRAPVTRVIVVSRGPLPHSWAAHFITGSEARSECTV